MEHSRSVFVVVSSPSVSRWWRDFVSADVAGELYWAPDEKAVQPGDIIRRVIEAVEPTVPVLVLSEHGTLRRDSRVVAGLRALGYRAIGAGPDEIMFELDKISGKRVFTAAGVGTPRWSRTPVIGHNWLFKSAESTAGEGVRWHDVDASAPYGGTRGYYEEFMHGTEYSVIVVVGLQGISILPPVWKGNTRKDLLPPYKRLRLCGIDVLDDYTYRRLVDAALRLAKHSFTRPCIAEIEFVCNGEALSVLEINPRIAGTTRMSALSGELRFIDLCLHARAGNVVYPTRLVAEFPVVAEGDRKSLRFGMYATSRLTIAGDTREDIRIKLSDTLSNGWVLDEGALRTFETLESIHARMAAAS